MPSLKDIRRRIGSVKKTQQITRAMRMVAAAKLRRAQDAIESARPYAERMRETLVELAASQGGSAEHPLLATRESVRKVDVVVVTADRGLCGAFNTNIIRAASHHVRANYGELNASGNVKLICIGRKGFDFFVKNDFEIANKHLGIFAGLNFSKAQGIVGEVVQGFLSEKTSALWPSSRISSSRSKRSSSLAHDSPARAGSISAGWHAACRSRSRASSTWIFERARPSFSMRCAIDV